MWLWERYERGRSNRPSKKIFNCISPTNEILACNNLLKHYSAQFRSFPVNSDTNRIPESSLKHYCKLAFTPLNLNIPENHISVATLGGIFSEAEEVINQKGGITSTVSPNQCLWKLQQKVLVKEKLPINPNFASPESIQHNVYQPNNSQ